MSERDLEFDALTEKDIFEECRDRLALCEEAESDNRTRAKDDLNFCEGDQWGHDVSASVSTETPELTINMTDMLVRRVVNNMKAQRPRGKCHPVGDGAQIEIAELINGIGRHIEYRSEASIAYDTGAEHSVKMGWGYWRMLTERVAPNSFDQDIRIVPIFNTFTVYMDPASVMPTACDAKWAIIAIKMKRTEYKRRYPRMPNVSWQDSGTSQNRDWEDKEEIRLAEYFRIREDSEKLHLISHPDGSKYTLWESEFPKKLPDGHLKVDSLDGSRETVEWFRLNGTRVVDRELIPGRYIPIIRCQGNAIDIDGRIRRRGMVAAMQDPQRMVNYGEVAKIRRLGLTPQSPWVAGEGQLDGHPEWVSTNQTPHPVLVYKAVTVNTGQGDVLLPPPQRQQPAQLEAGFAEFTAGMRSNLLAIAGMPNEPGQDTRGTVVSGLAQERRDKTSDQSHYQYYDNQTLAIAHTWRIILEWIPHYYSERRMQRIIGEDGVPEMVEINGKSDDPAVTTLKNDVTVGRYDVVMDTGPGYDTKREEGAEALLELVNSSAMGAEIAKVGPDLVLRSLDHPYMQELADRFAAMTPDGLKKVMESLPSRAKAIVQSLANQVQQLTQQLQQAQSGMAKAHLDATVKAHDVEESNRTKRLDTMIRSHTALAVEEIRAGGKILDTHVAAGHEAAAAERMIQTAERAEGSSNGSGST